ncbi:hypothetical protein PRZ48_002447 [Zasmidium cellare]|uniref:Uncharacterized protein n=1 Tax=Zasmidium cellare TaxID=395010 RepID=A0ABR0F6D2_ZASCE|nr:hypothetical protein PRZ48_002447 [Zasmidium cellare]
MAFSIGKKQNLNGDYHQLTKPRHRKNLASRIVEEISLRRDPAYRHAKKAEKQAKQAEKTAVKEFERKSQKNLRAAYVAGEVR